MSRASLLLIALAGCYGPAVPEGRPCSETKQCPAPQVCDDGTCRNTTLAADGSSDVAVFDDAPDEPLVDAAIDATGPSGCSQPMGLGAFGVPVHLGSLAASGEDGTPMVTSDHLEMYFKSDRAGGIGGDDIWRTTRSSTSAAWSAPTNVTELNSSADDGSPELSANGLNIYISSSRAGGMGSFDIWRATRLTTGSAWQAPVHVPALSSVAYEEGFMMLPSGLVGYLHSSRAAASNQIFRATRGSIFAAWGTPVLVAEISTSVEENPMVTADDCAMYFQSVRGGMGIGATDIWVSTRPTPTSAWGTPVMVPGVNSSTFDADPWVSADQRRIVFSSYRTGNSLDLHEATR